MFLVDASWLPRLQQRSVALYKGEKLARHRLKKKTQSNRSWDILSLDPTFTTMQHKSQNITSCQASVPLALIIRDVNPFSVSCSISFIGFTKKNKACSWGTLLLLETKTFMTEKTLHDCSNPVSVRLYALVLNQSSSPRWGDMASLWHHQRWIAPLKRDC